MSKDTFEALRPKIDQAVRDGLTVKEFLELHNISRRAWYTIKPKGFHWAHVQVKLGIERKYRKKLGSPGRPADSFYLDRASKVALVISKEITKNGFSSEVKNAMTELKQLNILLESIENEN